MVIDFENSSICLGIGVTLDTLVSAKLDFNLRQCVHMHYQMTFKIIFVTLFFKHILVSWLITLFLTKTLLMSIKPCGIL